MNTARSDVSGMHSGSRDPLVEFKHLREDAVENSVLLAIKHHCKNISRTFTILFFKTGKTFVFPISHWLSLKGGCPCSGPYGTKPGWNVTMWCLWPSLFPQTSRRKESWLRCRGRGLWQPWCGLGCESSPHTELQADQINHEATYSKIWHGKGKTIRRNICFIFCKKCIVKMVQTHISAILLKYIIQVWHTVKLQFCFSFWCSFFTLKKMLLCLWQVVLAVKSVIFAWSKPRLYLWSTVHGVGLGCWGASPQPKSRPAHCTSWKHSPGGQSRAEPVKIQRRGSEASQGGALPNYYCNTTSSFG